jgi:hypothetical protein
MPPKTLQVTTTSGVNLFNWLTSPSESFANTAEFICDVGLIVATFVLILGVVAEYVAEHQKIKWWEDRKRIWAIVVVICLAAEMFTEAGSFGYSSRLSQLQQGKIQALESRLAARSILPNQEVKMSADLIRFGGQSFEMVSYTEDKESADLADQIAATVRAAGWSPRKTDVMGIGEVIAGVVVYVNDDAPLSAKTAADALVATLNANQIAAVRRAGFNKDPTRLKITVGIKP